MIQKRRFVMWAFAAAGIAAFVLGASAQEVVRSISQAVVTPADPIWAQEPQTPAPQDGDAPQVLPLADLEVDAAREAELEHGGARAPVVHDFRERRARVRRNRERLAKVRGDQLARRQREMLELHLELAAAAARGVPEVADRVLEVHLHEVVFLSVPDGQALEDAGADGLRDGAAGRESADEHAGE